MDTVDVAKINEELEPLGAVDMLKWAYENFDPNRIKLSTSFGAEGMVLVHTLANLVENPRIFTIDTGRNFPETYEVWQDVIDKYGVTIESYGPDPKDIDELIREQGPNLFYQDIDKRKRCCQVRKVKPMHRALADADVWITGIRRQQSASREHLMQFFHHAQYDVYRLCPLVRWTETNVWEYIRSNDVPYNKLHDLGYPTIGCQPCSRPVRPAEDIRGGRWWWEKDGPKECGIHIEDGKVVRDKKPITWNI